MRKIKVAFTFGATAVSGAINSAIELGLFCGYCVGKLETMGEMSQSAFCPSCQAAVHSQLEVYLEEKLKNVLASRGLPANAVQIAKEQFQ